jgi:hypothetical protein
MVDYNQNWLSDFANSANKQGNQNAFSQNYYNKPAQSGGSNYDFYGNGYGQQNQQPQYQTQLAQPQQSLVDRYMHDNMQRAVANSSLNQMANYANPTNTIGGMANTADGAMAQQMPSTFDNEGAEYRNQSAQEKPIYDEGNELINVKKQPKAAYDWSSDFG